MRHFLLFWVLLFFSQPFFSQSVKKERPKIGVVLSGGGAKGLAHIGVLKMLEQYGIPVDYIGGTSMGSIIGGLYAIGYTANQLDSVVKNVNWEDLLSDKISRRNLSVMEKDEDVKYMISFPIRESKITLPSGLISGQNIASTFQDLCSPVYNITDFSKFHIPFLCIASDIDNGQPMVIKSGSLPVAMRASMAIPTAFTPEMINGKPTLDGGMVNNFPVDEVRKMGADIIIGVDVGFNYDRPKNNLTMIQIIEQSVFMHSKEWNLTQRKGCNILILPDLTGYSTTSFNHSDSLIVKGYNAAYAQLSSIKQLAQMLKDSFGYVKPPVTPMVVKKTDYYIDNIKIEGLSKISDKFILRKIPFAIPGEVKVADIESFIKLMYGTWFFQRFSYSVEVDENGKTNLVFKAQEKNTNYFRAGLHYDNDFKTTLVLNTSFRNVFTKGSKITLDLALGENPFFSVMYYKNSGWASRSDLFFWSKFIPDYGFKFQTHNYEIYAYDNDEKTASLGFVDVTSEFFLQGNVTNNNVFGVGILSDYTKVSSRIATTTGYDLKSHYMNVRAYYKSDSYDQAFFPSSGEKIFLEAKFVKGLSADVKSQPFFLQAKLRSDFVQAISRKLSVSESINAGFTFKDTITSPYWFYLGGLNPNDLRGLMPFVGLDFMQRAGNHVCSARFDFQWEMWNDNFLILKTNVGKTSRTVEDFLSYQQMIYGAGISYGYRSPIGPMELTVMTSDKTKGLSAYVSIGFWF
jgi:NTE family protein